MRRLHPLVGLARALQYTVYGLGMPLFGLSMARFVFDGALDLLFPVAAVGLSAVAVTALVVPILLLGMLLAVFFPVAIYLDAEAVADAGVGWDPDPFLYGLLGAAGLFAGGAPVQPVLGLYYLYRRHEHVGTP